MNSSKISLKYSVFIISVFAILFYLVFVFFPVRGLPIKPANVLIFTEQTTSSIPVRLKIPSINVDADIEHVGIAPDGSMDVPKQPENAAWFNLGPYHGEIGSSVIDGHFGYKNNIPAIFDNLHKLKKGDKIYIEDEKGATIIFVVREIRIYDKDADASDVFSSSDGKAHLNLITCTGEWNKDEKTRSDRLVVFSEKE